MFRIIFLSFALFLLTEIVHSKSKGSTKTNRPQPEENGKTKDGKGEWDDYHGKDVKWKGKSGWTDWSDRWAKKEGDESGKLEGNHKGKWNNAKDYNGKWKGKSGWDDWSDRWAKKGDNRWKDYGKNDKWEKNHKGKKNHGKENKGKGKGKSERKDNDKKKEE